MNPDFHGGDEPSPEARTNSPEFKVSLTSAGYREAEKRQEGYEHRSPALRVLRGGGRSELTLEELALDLDVTKATVSRWLSGKRPWPERLTEVLLEDWNVEPERVRLAMASAASRRERFLQGESGL